MIASKRTQEDLNKKHELKLRETKRKMNHSMNFTEVQAMSRMRHSITSNSRSRAPRHTEAFLEKSIVYIPEPLGRAYKRLSGAYERVSAGTKWAG
jgi:hypothetical protein